MKKTPTPVPTVAAKSFGRYLARLRRSHPPLTERARRGIGEGLDEEGTEKQGQKDEDVDRKRRRRAGLTQSDVAAAIGVTKGYIAMFEAGHRVPNALMVPKLAQFFGVDATQMSRLAEQAYAGVPISPDVQPLSSLKGGKEMVGGLLDQRGASGQKSSAIADAKSDTSDLDDPDTAKKWLDWAWKCVASAPDFPSPELRDADVSPDVKKVIIELYESGSGRRFLLPERAEYPMTADYDALSEIEKARVRQPIEDMSSVEMNGAKANEGHCTEDQYPEE